MSKRAAEAVGIFFLVVFAVLYIWTAHIPDPSHLRHGAHKIEIDASAGGIDVVGERRNDIAVTLNGTDAASRGVKVDVEQKSSITRVVVRNIPNNARLEIHIPEDSSVGVDMSAGQLNISGVHGDIASLLRSGQMTINIDDAANFARADASVFAGDVSASPFNRHKGGLLRRFVWSGHGTNNIYAHVSAGQLTVR